MKNINLNSLYYFFEIAKEGSLKKAALKLHLTQPTLSHQLRSLEDSLGLPLFNRVGKSLVINAEGKLVLEYCYKVFPNLNELRNVLELKRNRATEQLNVGVLPSMSKISVYKYIAEYIRDQTIKVTINEDGLSSLLHQMENKNLDIIFIDHQVYNLPKTIIQKKLYEGKFSAVCNPKCTLVKKKFPNSMEGLPFINYTKETYLHDRINSWLNKKKVIVQNFTEVDDTSLIKEILLNQKFAAIVPREAVEREIKEKKLKELGRVLELKNEIFTLINDDNTNPVITQLFKDHYSI
jgi:LysR family transcriptional activator of nhaA